MNTAILQFLRAAWLPLVFIVAAAGVGYNTGHQAGYNAGVASQRDENQQLTLKKRTTGGAGAGCRTGKTSGSRATGRRTATGACRRDSAARPGG
ncbi:hypothetical protein OS42_13400 [Dickeya oryzae]